MSRTLVLHNGVHTTCAVSSRLDGLGGIMALVLVCLVLYIYSSHTKQMIKMSYVWPMDPMSVQMQ